MILSRQVFDYQNRPLIEKVRIKTPFRYEALFPNKGCFLYIKGNHTKIHSAVNTTEIPAKDGILLKCGNYFVDWVGQIDNDMVEVIAFHLYPNVLQQLYEQELPDLIKRQLQGEQVSRLANDSIVERFIENLQFYFDNPSLVNEDVLELKIKELILLLVQSKSAQSITEVFSELFTSRSTGIKEVVSVHVYSNLSVPELAQLCGMSISTFKREFERVYNQSPNNYLIDQRLQKSSELLQNTQKTISEIAYETGFNDPAYFARLFKKRLNLTPSEFRLSKMD